MHRLQIGELSRGIGPLALLEAGAPSDAPTDPIHSGCSFECAQRRPMKHRHHGLLDLLQVLIFFFWPTTNRGRPAVQVFDQYEDLGQGRATKAWNCTAVASACGTLVATTDYRTVKKQLPKLAFEFAQSLTEVAACWESLDYLGTFESSVRTILAFVNHGYPKEQVGQGQAVRSLKSLGFGIRDARSAWRLRALGTSDFRRATLDPRLAHHPFPMPRQIIGIGSEQLPNARNSSENETLSKFAKIAELGGGVLVGVAYCHADHRGHGSNLMFLFWIFSWFISARCEARVRLMPLGAEAVVEWTRAVGRRACGMKNGARAGRLLDLVLAPASTALAWSRLESQIRRRDRLIISAPC